MESLSSLQSFDSMNLSHKKRKIIECEKDDLDERFWKLQRKKELRRVTARASLVVDDYEDERDEDDHMHEQMDWLEKESEGLELECDVANEAHANEGALSSVNVKENNFSPLIPQVKWKDERRRLLKISMAKIQDVDDPESYLRRSVLINNTVKRLQKDAAITYRHRASFVNLNENMCGSATFQDESWEFEDTDMVMLYKRQVHSGSASVGFECSSVVNSDSEIHVDTSEAQIETSCNSVNFHLSFASTCSSNSLESMQQDILCTDEKKLDPSMTTRTVKQVSSSIHLYPSRPCGLQYRNTIHSEEVIDEYSETSTSTSLLDSVVYHSLIASLES